MNREKRHSLFTAPNLISLLRILLIPLFLLMMLRENITAAFAVFMFAASTDFLDGLAARIWNQKTKLGAFLDPAADKTLMTTSFIILSYPSLNDPNVIPLWLSITVIGRDVLIVSAAALLFKTIRQKTFTPTILGKISTVCQMGVLLLVLFFNVLEKASGCMAWFYRLTLVLTVLSALHYASVGIKMISNYIKSANQQ